MKKALIVLGLGIASLVGESPTLDKKIEALVVSEIINFDIDSMFFVPVKSLDKNSRKLAEVYQPSYEVKNHYVSEIGGLLKNGKFVDESSTMAADASYLLFCFKNESRAGLALFYNADLGKDCLRLYHCSRIENELRLTGPILPFTLNWEKIDNKDKHEDSFPIVTRVLFIPNWQTSKAHLNFVKLCS